MAELGETTNPKELVPGQPAHVDDAAEMLGKQGEKFDIVARDLRKVDVGGWQGQASTSFQEMFSLEPPKWIKACEALETVSGVLTEHAETLRWAQAQAAQAVEIWERGEAATERATAEHNAAVANANTQNTPTTVGPFTDPGEAMRQEARDLLEHARGKLRSTGDQHARTIGGQHTDGTGVLGGLVDAVTGGWSAKGKAEASGPGAGFEAKGPGGGKLGELKAFAQLGKASAEGTVGNDLYSLSGKAEASVGAEATVAASLTDEGLNAKAQVAAMAKASAEGRSELGPFGGYGKVEGQAGAQAGAGATLNKSDGLKIGADAFAGAKGTAKGGGDVGGIGINATAEGWAGAGAEAGITIGPSENGTFEIGADAGAAVGLGGKLGFEVTIDPAKVQETAGDAVSAIGELGDAAGDASKTISGWLE
ncbi:hypothetical protein GIY23_04485 [Allosaccharopolyspora coralli]|uniref:Putative T7SS secretion signal domain-containing protein n=1 Tax=Allosaccharopolyspora coralli TaxID=2665642 RepID=A0A5Q3Q603_9PSEU|nr:hypothetical protein [Allosaccharopolyspora coralli]QGK68896.1 hypothetical protein GIY23_04485 [Allosaccharopolyspora coralli]